MYKPYYGMIKRFNISDIGEVQYYLDDLRFRLVAKQDRMRSKGVYTEKQMAKLDHQIDCIANAQEQLYLING